MNVNLGRAIEGDLPDEIPEMPDWMIEEQMERYREMHPRKPIHEPPDEEMC